jgi:hypothetical protein
MFSTCNDYLTINGTSQWKNLPAHILHQKSKRPPNGSKPLSVKVGIYIENLGKFQATEMVIFCKNSIYCFIPINLLFTLGIRRRSLSVQ